MDEKASEIMEEVLKLAKAEKVAWVTCPHCNHRSKVMVADSLGAMKAIDWLSRRGAGAAPDVPVPEAAGLTVVRSVVPPVGADDGAS